MFSVDSYLKYLGYTGPLGPSVDSLRELHRKQMTAIPFDNSRHADKGVRIWEGADADADAFYDLLITRRQGGVCHELSGLFRALLAELGYDVTVISSGVRGANDEFGPDLEHMLSLVRLNGEAWLVDVGFAGSSFIEPIRVSGDLQHQFGFDYQVVEDGPYLILRRRGRDGPWQPVYRFTVRKREPAEWTAIADSRNADPDWHAGGEIITAGTLIYGRAFENGKLVLVGRRHLRAEDGRDHVRVLAKKDEYLAAIRHILRQETSEVS